MMTTVETIVDTTTDLQDGVHMSDPHLEVFMTPIWTDALLLAETIMPMVAIHTEAEVLEDLPLGIYFLKTSDFFICKLLICTVGLVSTLRQLCDLQDPTTFDKCFFYFAKLSVTSRFGHLILRALAIWATTDSQNALARTSFHLPESLQFK